MANGDKGSGEMPPEGEGGVATETAPIIAAGVGDHGPCQDCPKTVDVAVDPFQTVGKNVMVCPECRANRITARAVEDKAKIDQKATLAIDQLLADAEDARQALQQAPLEFPK